MKKLALLALLSLTCSSKRSVIVVSLSYDATVTNADAIKNLQVTVEGVLKNYPVPGSAPFGRCTANLVPACTLEIDTDRPGRLDVSISGTNEIADAGYSVFGTGSGSAMADPNKVQLLPIQLSCSNGGCGTVVGTDGGAGAGGSGGSLAGAGGGGGAGGVGSGGRGGGTGGTLGAGGNAAGAGGGATAGVTGSGGMAGASGAAGRGGATGTAGTSGAAGTSGSAGTSGAAGTSGSAGRGGTTGAGGTSASGGTSGAAGSAGRGGTTGSAGTSGAAGTSGQAGAGGTVGGANCVDAIKLNGYAWTGAPPCSACTDSGVNQATKCQSIINCLDQNYPCSGNCQTNCQNQAGANLVVLGCVNALLAAASCN